MIFITLLCAIIVLRSIDEVLMVSRGFFDEHVYCRGGSLKLAIPFLRSETDEKPRNGRKDIKASTLLSVGEV